tara:strand:- start:247 stop:939 length:693 start_codon:yes stop_codon:yes gene_type:complete
MKKAKQENIEAIDKIPVKKPKKRGRKPKKKEPVKQEGDMDIQENLIIKLNHSEEKEDPILAYQENDSSKKCENNCSELCWNCSHAFDKSIIGIPLKYDNDIFYIYGDFCSLECGARYAYEYLPDKFRDIYSLINLYNQKLNPQESIPIELAPNKLLLKAFGGELTIDEYRKNNINNKYNIILPQIIPIRHVTDSQEILNSVNNKSNYKLYRKSALPSEKKSMKDFIKHVE